MPDPIAGKASPAGVPYAQQALQAEGLSALKSVATWFDLVVKSETKTITYLKTDAQVWPEVGGDLNSEGDKFRTVAGQVKDLWDGPEAEAYMTQATDSSNSILRSADAIGGGGGGKAPGGPDKAGGANLAGQVQALESNLTTLTTSVASVLAAIAAADLALNSPLMNPIGGFVGSIEVPFVSDQSQTEAVTAALKDALARVGAQMDVYAGQYLTYGQQVATMAANVKWVGAHGDGKGPGAPRSPGSQPSAAPPGGAPPGGAPTDPGATAPETGAGEEPGGAPPGAGGETPETGAGGPDLAGMPPVATPPLTPLPTIPKTPAITPLAPLGPLPGLTALPATPVGSSGRFGGGGLGGAGVSGLGGVGGGKPGALKGLESLPVAAKDMSGAGSGTSVGRAPALPGQGLISGAGTGSAGGGMPPMMPPMAGAGGGGGGGKPGNGATKPNGRQRQRAGGPTPGVPDRLRGKSGNNRSLPGTPAVAATRRRRTEDLPETLDILDEELWAVQPVVEAQPAAQQRLPRAAN